METFKMIIIDDEPNFADSLAETIDCDSLNLEILGTFSNGTKALEFMDENNVDIVLTDIKMPGMDGIEFVKECTQYFPNTVIIFMSAYGEFDAAKFALQNNVKGYLLKPVVYSELIDVLHKVTQQLKKNVKTENFNPLLFSYQQIFSGIFYGTISNKESLIRQWQMSGLAPDNIYLKYAVIRITLREFSDYLENVWMHEYYRFFDAVNSIIQFSSKEINFYIIKYCYNALDLIAFGKDDNIDVYLSQQLQDISSALKTELKIKNSAEILGKFDNVLEMLGYKFEISTPFIQKNTDIIDTAIEFMKENYVEDISLTDVAAHVFLSPAYFSVLFKQKTNENFTAAMNRIRIEAAKKLLREEDIKPSNVYQRVGFKSYTYFFKRFKAVCGMTPNEYKKMCTSQEPNEETK